LFAGHAFAGTQAFSDFRSPTLDFILARRVCQSVFLVFHKPCKELIAHWRKVRTDRNRLKEGAGKILRIAVRQILENAIDQVHQPRRDAKLGFARTVLRRMQNAADRTTLTVSPIFALHNFVVNAMLLDTAKVLLPDRWVVVVCKQCGHFICTYGDGKSATSPWS
jgi:hypothetical protein